MNDLQSIEQQLNALTSIAKSKISQANSVQELINCKVEFLGRNSYISNIMRDISNVNLEIKKIIGQNVNLIKNTLQTLIDDKTLELEHIELTKRLKSETIDLTIPHLRNFEGSIHPITHTMNEIIKIFARYGFDVKYGPSIETQWYNFTALNIPKDHPARQMHDTFYLQNEYVLRTHTSPIQIRAMENGNPPFSFIAPGRTYRSDSDATHTPMFHQIEGLVVDKNVNMGHLKHIIFEFIKAFFGQNNCQIRFRPSFFPFTEPSAEVDILIFGQKKWLEVMGCGMVHPNVLKNVGIDPGIYSGFAFGLGVERFAMLKYEIKDLREFFESDIRWLSHYSCHPLETF